MHYIQKFVDLPTGVTLETALILPKKASLKRTEPADPMTHSEKLAVFCHPWSWLGGRMEDPVLHQLVEPFWERGYYVALFNARGVGNSTKWPSFSALAEVEDLKCLVQALVQELNSEGHIDHVTLLGYSHGGISVSHHPPMLKVSDGEVRVSHIILSYPLSPMPLLTLFHHGTHATALQTLVKDPGSNVLIVYGTRDQFTAEGKYDAWSQLLRDDSPRLEVKKVEDADHFWGRSQMSILQGIVGLWLDRI